MTLNGVIALTSRNRSVILPNLVAFGDGLRKSACLKIHRYFLSWNRPRNVVLVIYHLWRYWQGITPESVKVRGPALASENLTNNQP